MRRLAAALAFASVLAALVGPTDTRAQGVGVERLGAPVVEVDPGSATTVAFRLTAMGARTVTATATPPSGWLGVAPPQRVALAAGEARVMLASFRAPATAAAGSYVLRYAVTGEPGLQPVTDSVELLVRTRLALELERVDAPRAVQAGRPYVTTFRVFNAGNAPAPVRLRLVDPPVPTAVLDPAAPFTLAPGETREITVSVTTDPEARRVHRHQLRVEAAFEPDTATAASAEARVEVVAAAVADGGRFHRFPLMLRVRANESDASSIPVELSGGGTLTERGSTRVDFLVRGPSSPHPLLAERDVYRVGLRTSHIHLQAGDQTYALSPLTERGRYGFGAGGTFTAGPLSVTGFAETNRHVPGAGTQWGGGLGVTPAAGVRFDANFLSTPHLGDLWSVRARLAPARLFQLDAEYGMGTADEAGHGRSLELRGAHRMFDYSIRHSYGDVDYPGYVRGTTQDHASVRVRPWSWLRWDASYHRLARTRAGADGVAGPGLESRVYRTGLAHLDRLLIEYRAIERISRSATGEYGAGEESVRLRLGFSLAGVLIQPEAEGGVARDRLTGEDRGFHRLGLQTRRRSRDGASWGLRLDYRSRGSLQTVSAGRLGGRADGSIPILGSTRLRASTHVTRYLTETPSTTTYFDVGIEQTIPGGGTLTARTRQRGWIGADASGRHENLHTLELAIPIGVPVSRMRSAGRLEVRLLEVESGQPVADVPIRIRGRTVFTDGDGRAVLTLPPGPHALDIDRHAVGFGRITDVPLPANIEIRGGHVTRVDIGVMRAGSISGDVRRLRFDESRGPSVDQVPPVVDAGGMRGVLLEARSGSEVHRRVTDVEGRFEFAGLRAGRWTVTVANADVPAHHTFDQDTLVFDLETGQEARAGLVLRPRHRPIRMIDGGVIQTDDAGPAQDRP